jgi:glycosyltransferase involved in cell wall biosynthesis
MAIKAISKIDKQHTLTIVGDGPELHALKILVIDLDLQERVVFAGILGGENLANCLNQHRFILIPSKWEEPFGLVALEGLACGCLPIVSDGGGLADAVGDAGVKFERNNEVALIEAINTITSDEQLEKRIRDAAPAQLANFSPTKIIQQYLEIIAALNQ